MTLEELYDLIGSARWFSELGRFEPSSGFVAIRSLEPWAYPDRPLDEQTQRIADAMDWLPTSRDQEDPIHGENLKKLTVSNSQADAIRQASLYVQKLVLRSLRRATSPHLRVGAHDFTEAAKGAAQSAVRQAVLEISLAIQDPFWVQLISIYGNGNWPCGLLPRRVVVVF